MRPQMTSRPGDLVVTATGLRFHGRRFPCTIGRGGLTDAKREGDGATPCGAHRLPLVLYRPDRIGRPVPGARAIGPRDLWSDDVHDPDYNRPVRTPHGFSHERLRRADPLYDLVLVTDWNLARPRPGQGSAIFVHRWRRLGHPTAGCVGLPTAALAWIVPRLTPRSRLILR